MKILRQVEFVSCMPIFFAQSRCVRNEKHCGALWEMDTAMARIRKVSDCIATYTVEHAKFASAVISRIRELVLHSRT